jgi:hypothetical protein
MNAPASCEARSPNDKDAPDEQHNDTHSPTHGAGEAVPG